MRVLCGTSQFTILIVHCSIECGLVARCSSERMSGHVPVSFGFGESVRRFAPFGVRADFFLLLHFGHLRLYIFESAFAFWTYLWLFTYNILESEV